MWKLGESVVLKKKSPLNSMELKSKETEEETDMQYTMEIPAVTSTLTVSSNSVVVTEEDGTTTRKQEDVEYVEMDTQEKLGSNAAYPKAEITLNGHFNNTVLLSKANPNRYSTSPLPKPSTYNLRQSKNNIRLDKLNSRGTTF
jgi:hypothetical protein